MLNILEIQTAFLAMTALTAQIMDNRVAVSYIQRQGGTHSRSLLREVEPIMLWAEKNLIDLDLPTRAIELGSRSLITELPG